MKTHIEILQVMNITPFFLSQIYAVFNVLYIFFFNSVHPIVTAEFIETKTKNMSIKA